MAMRGSCGGRPGAVCSRVTLAGSATKRRSSRRGRSDKRHVVKGQYPLRIDESLCVGQGLTSNPRRKAWISTDSDKEDEDEAGMRYQHFAGLQGSRLRAHRTPLVLPRLAALDDIEEMLVDQSRVDGQVRRFRPLGRRSGVPSPIANLGHHAPLSVDGSIGSDRSRVHHEDAGGLSPVCRRRGSAYWSSGIGNSTGTSSIRTVGCRRPPAMSGLGQSLPTRGFISLPET